MESKRIREISPDTSLDDLLAEVNSSFEPVFTPNPMPTFQQVSLPIQRKSPCAAPAGFRGNSPVAGYRVSVNSGLLSSRRGVLPAGQVTPTEGLGHHVKSLNDFSYEIPGTPSKDIPGTPSTQSAWSDEDISCFPSTPVASSLPGTPHGEGVCAAPMKDADLKSFKAPRMSKLTTGEAMPCSNGVVQTNSCSFVDLKDWVEGHKKHSDDASLDSASDHQVSDTKSEASGDESTTPKATQAWTAPATTKSATPIASSILNLVQGIWETRMRSRVLINGRKATWTSGTDHMKLGCTATMSEVNCSTLEMCFDTSKGDTSWQATVKMSRDGSLNLVWTDGDQWRKINTPAIAGQGDTEERAKATPPEHKGTLCVFSGSDEPVSVKRTLSEQKVQAWSASELRLSSTAATERDVVAGLASLSTASLTLPPNSQISQLQGVWTYNRATKGPVKVKIEGDTVIWPLGEKAKIAGEGEAEEGNEFMLRFEGQDKKYYAKVRPDDGALCWNDGAIWTRVIVTPPLQERPEQPSSASLHDQRGHDSVAGSLAICSQPSLKENRAPVCPESRISELQGIWIYKKVTGHSVKVRIDGDTVSWPFGDEAKINAESTGNEFVLQLPGDSQKYYAALRPEDDALYWSDGAVWNRAPKM